MNHETHRRGACGKRCYPSKKAAKRAHSRARFRLRTYFCDLCHAWHCAARDKFERSR